MKKKSTLRILLADDDTMDRELFAEALDKLEIDYTLTEARNGKEVMDFMIGSNQHPDLIFLDLNMPVVDGREALAFIKSSDAFKAIPVIILSTSNAHDDIVESYQAGANLFLIKQPSFNRMIDSLKCVIHLFHDSMNTVAIP